MAVWALGINHTTAPLDLRGRFAFALDQIAPTVQGLRQSFGGGGSHQTGADGGLGIKIRPKKTIITPTTSAGSTNPSR